MTQGTQTTIPILGTPILGTNQLQPVELDGVGNRLIYRGSCLLTS